MVIDRNVLKKIKSEYHLRNRLFFDIFSDVQATKSLCERICVSSNIVRGYVQDIHQDPFGFLMISEIQVISIFFLKILDTLLIKMRNFSRSRYGKKY